MLSEQDRAFYAQNGYLKVPGAVSVDQLTKLRGITAELIDQSRDTTVSDDRFDLDDGHTRDAPRLTRIKLPHKQHPYFWDLLRNSAITDILTDLLGPDTMLQTSKLNTKAPGGGAAVEWHQDWAFYPYTNDDVLAVGLIIDDMGPENGPLMVIPGSHKGAVYNHHHNGVFAGAMDLQAEGMRLSDAVPLQGPAGSVSIHHARIAHGSALNTSTKDRRIIFYEMMAADAFPIVGGRGKWEGLEEFDSRMLCGNSTLEPRVVPCPVRIAYPEASSQGSIYEVQKAMGKRSFAVADQRNEHGAIR